MKYRLRVTFALVASLSLITAMSSEAKPGSSQSRGSDNSSTSLDQVDSRLNEIQQQLTELTVRRDQLRNDSTQAASQLTQGSAANVGAFENRITQIDQEIVSLQQQRSKLRQDSLTLFNSFLQQDGAAQREASDLQLAISTANNEISSLTRQKELSSGTSTNRSSQNTDLLIKQESQTDSSIVNKQITLSTLTSKRDQLKRDSLSEESKNVGAMLQITQALSSADILVQNIQKKATDLNNQIRQLQQESTSSKQQGQQKLASINAQLIQANGSYKRLKGEYDNLALERDRLTQSAGAVQQRYEQGRAPFSAALTKAESDLAGWTREKDALIQLQQKIKIDSTIAKVQDEIDRQVQLEAQGKRAAKKIVQQKEDELNQLMGQVDPLNRNPDVARRAASMNNQTNDQKKQQILKLLSDANNAINGWTTKKMQSQQALSNYEQSNPAANNPSVQKLKQLEGSIDQKKAEIAVVANVQDSLTVLVSTQQELLGGSGTGSQRKVDSLQNLLAQINNDKVNAYTRKQQAQSDSATKARESGSTLGRVKADLSSLNFQITTIQTDLNKLNTRKQQIRTSIQSSQEKDRQDQITMRQQSTRIDSIINAKQQQVTSLLLKGEQIKSRKDISKHDYEINRLRNSRGIYQADSTLFVRTRDRTGLDSQRNLVLQAKSESDRKVNDKLKQVRTGLYSVNQQMTSLLSEQSSLQRSRKAAFDQLKSELAQIESQISGSQQQLLNLETARSKARLDSIANLRKNADAISKIASKTGAIDNDINTSKQQLNGLNAKIEKSRQDSVRTASTRNAAMMPYRKSIRQIDSMISVKEQEILSLRNQRIQSVQDSLAEIRKQGELVDGAHNEIMSNYGQMAQLKSDIDRKNAERQRLQKESDALNGSSYGAPNTASQEISRLTNQISMQHQQLSDLQSQKAQMELKVRSAAGSGGYASPVSTPPPSPSYNSSPSSSKNPVYDQPSAQKYMEDLYNLLGSDQTKAIQKYKIQRENLRRYLDADAFQALDGTMKAME